MKLEIDTGKGRQTFDYDPDALMIDQALVIEKHIGAPLGEWESQLLTGATKAYMALAWIVFHQCDPGKPIAEVTDFPLNGLMTAYMAVRLTELSELKAELEKAVADEAAKAAAAAEAT